MKILVTTLLVAALAIVAFGAELSNPVLLTTIGQSADLNTSKLMLKKAGVDTTKFVVDKLAGADKVPANGTLVLVLGASNKGLGEARISIEQEITRGKALVDAAKKAKAKIVIIHIGGKERRGGSSDEICKALASSGDFFVVKRDGDEDGLFKKAAGSKKYVAISKIGDGIAPLKAAFGN